jgi:hypothetical protein
VNDFHATSLDGLVPSGQPAIDAATAEERPGASGRREIAQSVERTQAQALTALVREIRSLGTTAEEWLCSRLAAALAESREQVEPEPGTVSGSVSPRRTAGPIAPESFEADAVQGRADTLGRDDLSRIEDSGSGTLAPEAQGANALRTPPDPWPGLGPDGPGSSVAGRAMGRSQPSPPDLTSQSVSDWDARDALAELASIASGHDISNTRAPERGLVSDCLDPVATWPGAGADNRACQDKPWRLTPAGSPVEFLPEREHDDAGELAGLRPVPALSPRSFLSAQVSGRSTGGLGSTPVPTPGAVSQQRLPAELDAVSRRRNQAAGSHALRLAALDRKQTADGGAAVGEPSTTAMVVDSHSEADNSRVVDAAQELEWAILRLDQVATRLQDLRQRTPRSQTRATPGGGRAVVMR